MLCLPAALPSMADININSETAGKAYMVSIPIAEYAKGRNGIQTILNDSVDITPGKTATLPTPSFNAVNKLTFSGNENEAETFYTAPADNVNITVTSTLPLDATLSGTPLIEGMEVIENNLSPVMEKYLALAAANALNDENMENIFSEYDQVLINAVNANPSAPEAVYAVMSMQRPETMIEMFGKLTPEARASIIFPLAESVENRARRSMEAEAKQKALETGHAPAPDFTLPDLEGKNVTLSSLRGKWVILDFWGSWCIWCIKGFPALKDAYAKYDGKLEIVGIDCGDTTDAWKAAVEKYKLPGLQLYNTDAPDSIDKTYGIQGFPTKVIINPEGNIVNITTGEDPSFFDKLDTFINK